MPQPYSATLQAARGRVGDPAAPSIPPHITLLGPTAVEPGDLAAVERHLEEVASHHRPFVLRLRGTGTFRPVSPVVFVQVVEGIAGCEALERHIRTGPLEQGLRFNYHPHVTVAHEVSEAALDLAFVELSRFDATFVVHAFHSYEYGDDEVWRPVRDFPLTGAADVAAARLHGSRVVPGAGVPGSS
ncbi:2'-5' RNA ligase family protein [Cellulomonas sp. WB94]|uniref:2'-5' RNA ligase family protein n=1 Tax=Cellulomonas sp. WB94 TaxID=2173174 RepID=UPI00322163DF